MGRGLSDLQKWILVEAYKHIEHPVPEKDKRSAEYEGMPRSWVYQGYFGWQLSDKWSWQSHEFSKDDIGEKEYNSVIASVSRACARLEARELITQSQFWWHQRIILTEQGVQTAKKLMEELSVKPQRNLGDK